MAVKAAPRPRASRQDGLSVLGPGPGDVVVFHDPDGWTSEFAADPPSDVVVAALQQLGSLVGLALGLEELRHAGDRRGLSDNEMRLA